MCQEEQTYPPMPVWLRTPRPNAPDVRPRCPPVQIILTLSASSPTGCDRSYVCVQTAHVQNIDPLTTCKTMKQLFQSASGPKPPRGGRCSNILGTGMNNFQPRICLVPSRSSQQRAVSFNATLYAAREAPRRTCGTDLLTDAVRSKTVLMFTASKLVILAAMLRMRAGIANDDSNSGIPSSVCSTPTSDAPSLSSQS